MTPTPTPPPIAGMTVTADGVDSGEAAFNRHAELDGHLGHAAFLALARQPKREVVVDNHPQRRAINAGTLLAVAIALSRRWRRTITAPRVGVALPPGIGAFAANLALTFAGKVPVNLNFTAGRAAALAYLRKAGLDTVISAPALQEKVPDFPWPERTLDIRAEIAACGKKQIVPWLLAVRVLPAAWLARRLQLPERGGGAEATILFTSGSSGEPKGVVLTHRNVLGNCAQIRDSGLLRRNATMIGCLPVFHSFGFTVTLWYAVLYDVRVATFPSPLETRRIAEIIAAEKAEILIGAPTFLRPFLKRAEPGQLASLNLVVAGAEKLPRDLDDGFCTQYGLRIIEGYGLTETSPVLSVNRPHAVALAAGGETDGRRASSVGLLLPGIRARIVDPATRETLPPTTTGVLVVRGCNIFGGYLDDPAATAAVLHDEWFTTGDLARFDADGFLHIEGRLSRFSKVGGEMVPHGTVEQAIIEDFGWLGAEAQPVVVVGVRDEAKGEALVVLTTQELNVVALREKLTARGLPNLWIPKRVVRLEKIPLLPTGKLDLRTCRQIAEEADGAGDARDT